MSEEAKPKVVLISPDPMREMGRHIARAVGNEMMVAPIVEAPKVVVVDDSEEPAKPEAMLATMKKFYTRLTGKQRRALRLAQRRVTGKKESIGEMLTRIHRDKQ